MNSEISAKKYFVYGFRKLVKNENKCLVKDRIPSLRAVIDDLLCIIDDINNELMNVKLEKAFLEFLELTKNSLKKSIINEILEYKVELDLLLKQLSNIETTKEKRQTIDQVKQRTKLRLMLESFNKKLSDKRLFKKVLYILDKNDKFIIVNRILGFVISDLLYDGYSLSYLEEWLSNNINLTSVDDKNIDNYIKKFPDLKIEEINTMYFMYIYNEKKLLDDIENINNAVKIKKITLEYVEKEIGKANANFLQDGEMFDLFQINVLSRDVYRGLSIINEGMNNYFQLILQLNNTNVKHIIRERVIVKLPKGKVKKIINKNYDKKRLFSLVESKEKRDMYKFIDYRKRMYQANICSEEIMAVQRSLNLINYNKYSTIETKFINMWSSIEYILTFHKGGSIISKVKDIIPKLVVLYYMHEKLNGFWHRVKRRKEQYKESCPEIIKELWKCCYKLDEDKYNTNALVEFITSNGEDLIGKFEFDVVLSREIAEIGLLLSNNKNRIKKLEEVYEDTLGELTRIYRLRNTIVHSGIISSNNYEIECLSLYQFSNNLLGVIIYYKDKNINSTLEEILFSISYTYENYMNNTIKSDSDICEICRPRYIFM